MKPIRCSTVTKVIVSLLTVLCLSAVSSFADVTAPTGTGYNEDTPQTVTEASKLKDIQVLGVSIPGFDANKLDYTYYMTAETAAKIGTRYAAAITAVRVDPDADLVTSTVGNKVLLIIHKGLQSDYLTYTVTFAESLSGSPSDVIETENNYLNELATSKFTPDQLNARINASISRILSEVAKVSTAAEAELTLKKMTRTLEALNGLCDKFKTLKVPVTQLTELTQSARPLVLMMVDRTTIADMTAGYLKPIAPLLSKAEPAGVAALKNSTRSLAGDAAYQIGIIPTATQQLKTAGSKGTITFDAGTITPQLDSAIAAEQLVSRALSTLLGPVNPQDIPVSITLKTQRPTDISTLESTIDTPLLNSIKSKGVTRLELRTGESGIAFDPQTGNTERPLTLSAAYSTNSGSTPAGTTPVPGAPVADLLLSSGSETITSFENPIQLIIDLSPADIKGYTPGQLRHLSIFVFNEDQKVWQNTGGNYDPYRKLIRTYRSHLSKYTVLKSDRSFSDVENSWAKEDINELLGKGILREDPAFAPKENLTREDFAIWISRAYNLDSGTQKLPFTDIPQNYPYYKELAAAYSQGLIKGKTANTFDPKAKITRQEMAVLVSNALTKYQKAQIRSSAAAGLGKYPDNGKVAAWAKNQVGTVNELGIMQGDARGFRPNDYITREEAARVLKTLYN